MNVQYIMEYKEYTCSDIALKVVSGPLLFGGRSVGLGDRHGERF